MISPLRFLGALLLVCAVLLLPSFASAASSSSNNNACDDPRFLQTWHDEFCCPPGFMFELDPPNRAVAGPRCTLCPIGTHFSCEDGNCCAAGTFCIRVDGQPRCSTTNVPSLFDSAPFPAPTGLLTNRTLSDVALDRHANKRHVPASGTMVLIIVFSCIGGVIFLVLCIVCCIWYHSSSRRRARERARDKETLERLEKSVAAQSAKASKPPVVVVVSSRTNTATSGSAANGESAVSSSELAPLSRGVLARGSSQSQLEEVSIEDAKVHFYPQLGSNTNNN